MSIFQISLYFRETKKSNYQNCLYISKYQNNLYVQSIKMNSTFQSIKRIFIKIYWNDLYVSKYQSHLFRLKYQKKNSMFHSIKTISKLSKQSVSLRWTPFSFARGSPCAQPDFTCKKSKYLARLRNPRYNIFLFQVQHGRYASQPSAHHQPTQRPL